MRINKILKQWKIESGTKKVIQYRYREGTLSIYTSQPGYLIGGAGALVNKYEEILAKELNDFKDVKFVETESFWV